MSECRLHKHNNFPRYRDIQWPLEKSPVSLRTPLPDVFASSIELQDSDFRLSRNNYVTLVSITQGFMRNNTFTLEHVTKDNKRQQYSTLMK